MSRHNGPGGGARYRTLQDEINARLDAMRAAAAAERDAATQRSLVQRTRDKAGKYGDAAWRDSASGDSSVPAGSKPVEPDEDVRDQSEADRDRADLAARLAAAAAAAEADPIRRRIKEMLNGGHSLADVHPTAPADLPNEGGASAAPSSNSVGNTSESENTQYSGSSAGDVARRAGTQWVAAAAKIGRRLAAGVLSPAIRVAEVLEEKGILPVPKTVTVRLGAESGGATTPSRILDPDNVRLPHLPDPIKRASPKGPAPN